MELDWLPKFADVSTIVILMSNLTFALPIGEQQDKVIQYARAHQSMEFPELAIEKKCVCPVDTCCQEFRGSSQLTMHILRRHDGCKLPVKVGQSSEHYCPVEGCHRAQGNSQPFPRLSQLKQVSEIVFGLSTKMYWKVLLDTLYIRCFI